MSILFLVCAIFVSAEEPEEVPPLYYVNDYADVLLPAEEEEIKEILDTLQDTRVAEFILVTTKNTAEYELEEFAKLVENGVIGGKNKQDGLLLLYVAEEEELYLLIEDELRLYISAKEEKEIIENYFKPNIKENNYYLALRDTSAALHNRIVEVNHRDLIVPIKTTKRSGSNKTMLLVAMLFVILIAWFYTKKRRESATKKKS